MEFPGELIVEDRKSLIIRYIKDHPGTPKGRVIEYMEHINTHSCSRVTTRKYIQELKDLGEIVIKLDPRPNNRTNYLFINDRHLFNRIRIRIEDIEKYIDEEVRKKPTNKNRNLFPRGSRDDFITKIVQRQIPSSFESVMWDLQLLLSAVYLFSTERETRHLFYEILRSMVKVTQVQMMDKYIRENSLGQYWRHNS